MRKSTRRLVVALAVCVLVPGMTAIAKDKVTRPFRMAADSQLVIIVDPTDPGFRTYEARAEGVATHLGRVTIYQAGSLLDPVATGTMTAANGDQLHYQFNSATSEVTIVDGTGRFAGAGGTFKLQIQPVGLPIVDAGTMTQNFTWTGLGTITY